MADPNLQFDPVDGWNDTSETVFKTNPSDVEVRPMFQRLFTQIQTFINTTYNAWINATFATRSEVQGIVLGQIPDGTITDAKNATDNKVGSLASLTTTEKTSVVAAVNKISDTINNLIVNSLLTNLQLTANSSNIDAWCDLIADTSMLDTANCTNYELASGELKALDRQNFVTSDTTSTPFANGTGNRRYSIGFSVSTNTKLLKCSLRLLKNGSPTDNLYCELFARDVGGYPTGSALATSDPIAGATLTGTAADIIFNFPTKPDLLTTGNGYCIVLNRSTAYNATNYYSMRTGAVYAGGAGFIYDGSTWSSGSLIRGLLRLETQAVVRWNPVVASEILSRMAIASSQNLNLDGSIQWQVSDNGINWVNITNLKQMYDTDFDGTNVYLKCIIQNDAAVSAVAWGGY